MGPAKRICNLKIALLFSALLGLLSIVYAEQLPIKSYTTADGLARDTIGRTRSRHRRASPHRGDLPGAPRTGRDLKMTSITIHRIANGKLVEKWSEKDVLGFLIQIGVIPSPGQQRG